MIFKFRNTTILATAVGLAMAPVALHAEPSSDPARSDQGDAAGITGGANRVVETDSRAMIEPIPFAAQFKGVIDPLGPDLAGLDLQIPETAVDLDTFEPTLETTDIRRSLGTGVASYYGRRFHGRLTANGERFNMRAMTAAHKTLPFGSKVRVTNPRNGREVTVRINDRGPFTPGRTIDLSRAAAERIGLVKRGHARVKLDLLAQ